MPVDSHLQWSEMRDFSAGLWTVNSQLMPPNAAQVMTDCFPAPSGGLKAWFKATSYTTTGLTTTDNPRMLFVHENFDGAGHNDNYILLYRPSDTVCRLYRLKEGTDVSWQLIKTHAGGLDPGFVRGCAYWTQAADGSQSALYMAYALGAGQGADAGLWTVKQSDGSIIHQSAAGTPACSYAFAYQSRLCAVKGPTIYFTDAGSFNNFATNLANIDIAEGQANILYVAAFSPGDLLVFKEGAPIYLVEGDLNNFTVRQMNGSKPVQIGGPAVVRGPQGLIFRVGSDGVYETPDGSFINPLSKALNSQEFVTTESLAWMNHWLMCGENGRIMDYDSHAWFTFSAMTAGSSLAFPLPRLGGFMFTDNATNFTINKVVPGDGRTDNRAESYTWKSGPLRDNNGRQMEIRAVEVYARSLNGATSTVAVTVAGTTQTLACDSSGRGGLTFYFLKRNEELDVQVVAASNQAGVGAPDIETVRFATQPGHFLRQVADAG